MTKGERDETVEEYCISETTENVVDSRRAAKKTQLREEWKEIEWAE